MSFNLPGLALSAAQIVLLNMAGGKTPRSFGGIIPAVVIKERHADRLEVTSHPVERGAAIADHAIKQPATVTLECGWSNSPAGSLTSLLTGAKPPLTVQEVYQTLLRQQTERLLVDVFTGKRFYKGMLLQSLEVETDEETEQALRVTVTFVQLILVGTATLTLSPGTATKQAEAAKTGTVADAGTKLLTAAKTAVTSIATKVVSGVLPGGLP